MYETGFAAKMLLDSPTRKNADDYDFIVANDSWILIWRKRTQQTDVVQHPKNPVPVRLLRLIQNGGPPPHEQRPHSNSMIVFSYFFFFPHYFSCISSLGIRTICNNRSDVECVRTHYSVQCASRRGSRGNLCSVRVRPRYKNYVYDIIIGR